MSLDFYLIAQRPTMVYERAGITHNLAAMAREAGIFKQIWHPQESGIVEAAQLVYPLRDAIRAMKADPARFKAHNPKNGWGSYEGFLEALEDILRGCEANPGASVRAHR